MTKDQVKEILDRVLSWPPERQADVAHVVQLMEAQDKSELRLSDEQLAEVRRHREVQRKSRSRARFAGVAVVGYTNAGKSTLVNRLTDAGVLVEDRLFATLDATTRRLHLPGGERVLLTDTVGFVKKLPHGLVEAFKTTLDVVLVVLTSGTA